MEYFRFDHGFLISRFVLLDGNQARIRSSQIPRRRWNISRITEIFKPWNYKTAWTTWYFSNLWYSLHFIFLTLCLYVFCDFNKILIFEFLYFYISLFLYFYIYPCPCAQTLHGNKRLYFRSTKWENVQVFRRPVRLRELQLRGVLIRGGGEYNIPPPQITFHSPLLTALVPFHIYPWFDLTLKLSFDCITYYYYLSTGPSHCTNGLGIIYPCYFRKDF